MRFVLRSKIHNAAVTDARVNYVGSISIDENLIEKAGFTPYERVLVVSNTTGARLETYVIPAPKNSGTIRMNGASAHAIRKGEEIIVMGFELTEEPIKPRIALVDEKNKFVKYL